jgi:hypothetical protein
MIYSHFVFAVLRVVSFSMIGMQISEDENSGGYPPIEHSILAAASSFLSSADVMTAVTIYVVPKLAAARNAPVHESTTPDASAEIGAVGHSKGTSQDKLGISVPSNDEKHGPTHQIPSGSLSGSVRSHETGHMRVGMDGIVLTDEEPESSSSDEEDWGGPRFAPSSDALGSVIAKAVIHSIEEEQDESTTSM